jgi:quercetin dioxygenase-like cupin family protein
MDIPSHFTRNLSAKPRHAGMYIEVEAATPLKIIDGITFTAFTGQNLLVNRAVLDAHTHAPVHTHAEEQLFILLEGELEFDLDGDLRQMRAGEMVLIPSWVPHGARTLDVPCVGVDVFSPPRSTLVEHAHAMGPSLT